MPAVSANEHPLLISERSNRGRFWLARSILAIGIAADVAAGASALKDKNGTAFDLVEAILAHSLIQSLSRSAEKKPTYIADHVFVSAMEAVLAEKLGSEAEFGEILSKLPKDSAIAKSLSAVIHDIEEDPNQCRAAVSTWFNEAMDRVGGWYKRKTKVILFAAGVVAAAMLNADSLSVTTRLWTDSSLRDQVSLVASNVLSSTPTPPVTPAVPAAATAGASGAAVSTVQPDSSALEKQLNYALAGLQKTSGQLYKLPIGWDSEARSHWSVARAHGVDRMVDGGMRLGAHGIGGVVGRSILVRSAGRSNQRAHGGRSTPTLSHSDSGHHRQSSAAESSTAANHLGDRDKTRRSCASGAVSGPSTRRQRGAAAFLVH